MAPRPGVTNLGDGSTTSKSDPRLAVGAYCEDAAANIGLALALGTDLSEQMIQVLGAIQNDLLDVYADVHTPVEGASDDHVRIDQGYLDRGRYLIDYYNGQLDDATMRVVPSGTAAAALIHKARTGVRLAEVTAWQVVEADGARVSRTAAQYLDVLGSLLLVLARIANAEHGDVVWRPGLSAAQAEEAATAMESADAGSNSSPTS